METKNKILEGVHISYTYTCNAFIFIRGLPFIFRDLATVVTENIHFGQKMGLNR